MDRIRQRAHSWTARFLSGAGKMILLKSVLTAMPTYAMSCFKLPLSLCKQLQSVLTRFWWDASPGVKKICWVSWQTLTKPKSVGGLGFREIVQFNDALLAKLSWRILMNPNSLLSRTLFGKYCVHSPFLEVQPPSSASHGWRGLLVGRDLLTKGLGWALGSGHNVNVWEEPWISTSEPLSPIGPPSMESRHWRVSDLIFPGSNEWNVEKIRSILPQYEDRICKLIPSSSQLKDERAWLFSANGEYTTKSGYAIAKLNTGDPAMQELNWKKCIWQVDTSPKIRHFLWKATSNALSVGASLETRGISVDPACKRCGSRETEFHVLFSCPFAKRVWDLAPCLFKPNEQRVHSVAELLTQCRRMISLPPVGLGTTPLYPWILWLLWINRNQLVFENKFFSEEKTILKAILDSKAWEAAQTFVSKPSIPQHVVRSSVVPFVPRVNSYMWSAFSDAAWDQTTGNCGIGWQLRDSENSLAEYSSSYWRSVPSALVAEALAVKAAINAAVSSQVSSLTVNSDSKNLILLLKTQGQDVALRGVLHDIHVLASSLTSIVYVFVPRLANVQADLLAKAALVSISFPTPIVE